MLWGEPDNNSKKETDSEGDRSQWDTERIEIQCCNELVYDNKIA